MNEKRIIQKVTQKLNRFQSHWGWNVVLLGTAKGSLELSSGTCMELSHEPLRVPFAELTKGFTIHSYMGKLADSMDSFVYCYTEVNPFRKGFMLEADMVVQESEDIPDYQTGYGICSLDALGRYEKTEHERNQLLVGRSRFAGGLQHAAGVRIVSGYKGKSSEGRILDSSRLFDRQNVVDELVPNAEDHFVLQKTVSGFTAAHRVSGAGLVKGDDDVIRIPGCDFLMQQDPKRLYIGFAVAGKIHVKISQISWKKERGRISETPKGTFQNCIAHYPFEPERVTEYRNCLEELPWKKEPDGSYILANGLYYPEHPMVINPPEMSEGQLFCLRAETPGGVVIDGAKLQNKLPLLMLCGNQIFLEGITIQNSPSCGIYIISNSNEVKDCIFRHNGDTGLLICSFPGAERTEWPAGNRVIQCESYDNCDPVRCNADGFGAKLRVGNGNRFERCVAHHNVDDGFDFYTKIGFGAIEPVVLNHCTAYENGQLSDGSVLRERRGSGFKLGGEQISVSHHMIKCEAYGNRGRGIDCNSNPAPVIECCRSRNNAISDAYSEENHKKHLEA